ncbi:MAG: BMP family ABC transporter substrate-binding protein [Mycoplasma sp.]|nr:BMP family ABC transporter substrate-binding protein [Mycoplasma sp.]
MTDAGDINDQSFNQQAWEALQFIQSGSNPNVDVFKPKDTSVEELYKAYIKAEQAGKKYIFANGYLHQPAIYKYNKEKDDNKITIKDRLKFFLIDEDYFIENKDQPNKETHKNVVSFKYDILPAGHQAGLLIGEYFKAKNQKNTTVGFWGGGPFDAVTDFIKGLLSGIQTFNSKNKEHKLKVANWQKNDQDNMLNSGFEAGNAKNQINYLLSKTPTPNVILPVAGPQFRDLIAELKKKKNTNVKMIGVDVDQHKNVSNDDKARYLTSILKNIKDTFYYANKIFIENENYTNLWNNKFTNKMLDGGQPKWGKSIYLSSDIGMTGITKLKDLPLFTNDNDLKIDDIWSKVIKKENQFDEIANKEYKLSKNETSGYYHFPWKPNEITEKLTKWITKINTESGYALPE